MRKAAEHFVMTIAPMGGTCQMTFALPLQRKNPKPMRGESLRTYC